MRTSTEITQTGYSTKTSLDWSIDLCIIRGAYHELLWVFRNFYASGTQAAEVTKSLIIIIIIIIIIIFIPLSSPKYWIPANQEAQSRSWSITDGFAHHNTLPSCGAQWMNPPLHTDQSDICAISPTCQRLSYQQCPTKNKLWESKQKNIMQRQVV